MSTDIANLRRLVALVDEKIAEEKAETGPWDPNNHDAWRQRHSTAVQKLIDFFSSTAGAHFDRAPASEFRVRMAGIRATSTSSCTGALHNWRAAASKKIEKLMAEGRP